MFTQIAAALVAATLFAPPLAFRDVSLQEPPGVGPAMATRIVEFRKKNGPFKKAEDLMNVKGIGEKSFLKLKALITVGAARGDA